MMIKKFQGILITSFCLCIFFISTSVHGQKRLIDTAVERARTDAYASQLETYLWHYLLDDYKARSAKAWNRDYSSAEALKRSVEPNRKRWEALLGPPDLRKTGPLARKPYVLDNIQAEWIELPLGPITAQAVLAFPKGANKQKPIPIVIVMHGIGSSPETPFSTGNYHEYAKELLNAGFAVLVPMNLRSIERRNHIERLCRLANTTLPGIELVRLQNLLDVVLADARIDAERVGMWGVSLGGMATMFWMPLEPRIKAGVVSGWFNERLTKMVTPDPRFVSFMATNEDHAFFKGWLSEFSDYDVVSLICPRPLLIQHGKKDNIAHWPLVAEEFDRAKVHYQKLNIPERMELTMHEGGHEAIIETGVKFMNRWLSPEALRKKM
jgi:dienelactone hydrolase